MLTHLIAILLFTFSNQTPNAYVDACPAPSASHYCIFFDPTEKRILTTATEADCPIFELGVKVGTLSADVLTECQ